MAINNNVRKKDSLLVYYGDEWILDIGVYFQILDNINNTYLDLVKCKTDNVEKIEFNFYYLSTELSRIIPIKNDELNINEGILKLKRYFNFIVNDYNDLFNNYQRSLIDINSIRNKYHHAPHTIHFHELTSSSNLKKIEFVYVKNINPKILLGDVEKWHINTNELKNIILKLNQIFIKIQNKFYDAIDKRNYNIVHPYMKKIYEIDINGYIGHLTNSIFFK